MLQVVVSSSAVFTLTVAGLWRGPRRAVGNLEKRPPRGGGAIAAQIEHSHAHAQPSIRLRLRANEVGLYVVSVGSFRVSHIREVASDISHSLGRVGKTLKGFIPTASD